MAIQEAWCSDEPSLAAIFRGKDTGGVMVSSVRAGLSDTYFRLRYPRFHGMRRRVGGMLSPAVYQRIYEEIRAQPDLDVVEIGGATGAGSIALYLGMRESGKVGRLIVVERCEGGSRSEAGGRDENLRRLLDHLRSFQVTENVEVFPHELTFENGDEVLGLCRSEELAAFVHDADGHIDRDFSFFWPKLRTGGLIVIDDYDERPHYVEISERYPQGGIKGVLVHRLLDQFIDWGLFEPTKRIGNTLFGRKPAGAPWNRFDLDRCREIHDLVRQERITAMEWRRGDA